jgi:hypothetical protein
MTRRALRLTQSTCVAALPGIGMAAAARATAVLIECGRGVERSSAHRPVDGDRRASTIIDERFNASTAAMTRILRCEKVLDPPEKPQ